MGYDSGNGVMAAFDIGADGSAVGRGGGVITTTPPTCSCCPDQGALVTGDYDASRMVEQVVVLDIATGAELARADTGGPLQSAVFPALGWDATLYWCSLSTVSRLRVS